MSLTARGLFVTFEGPEGAGKSTQVARLAARLAAAGVPHLQTREPGGTPLGTQIRELVLHGTEPAPMTEFLLYSASRAELVGRVLRPALAAGVTVLCDRYLDSSYAYQGHGRGLPLSDLRAVSAAATGGLHPDLTVLLDLDPALGLARAAQVGAPDRLERADLAFHLRVRDGFLRLAAAEPQRFVVLDAARAPGELDDLIWAAVSARLPGPPAPAP